jgi:hypothetical protein
MLRKIVGMSISDEGIKALFRLDGNSNDFQESCFGMWEALKKNQTEHPFLVARVCSLIANDKIKAVYDWALEVEKTS